MAFGVAPGRQPRNMALAPGFLARPKVLEARRRPVVPAFGSLVRWAQFGDGTWPRRLAHPPLRPEASKTQPPFTNSSLTGQFPAGLIVGAAGAL